MLHYYPDETSLAITTRGMWCTGLTVYILCYETSSMKTFVAAPTTTRTRPNAGSMLSHRLRRWPNIEPALVQRLVYVGVDLSDDINCCIIHIFIRPPNIIKTKSINYTSQHRAPFLTFRLSVAIGVRSRLENK